MPRILASLAGDQLQQVIDGQDTRRLAGEHQRLAL
jgi:hypothetical protein